MKCYEYGHAMVVANSYSEAIALLEAEGDPVYRRDLKRRKTIELVDDDGSNPRTVTEEDFGQLFGVGVHYCNN